MLNKKIKILFDVSSLIDGVVEQRGNGIFFAAYNIFVEMLKRDCFEVQLYCNSNKAFLLPEVKNIDKNFELALPNSYTKIEQTILDWEKLRHDSKDQKDAFIKSFSINVVLSFFKLVSHYQTIVTRGKNIAEKYRDIDVFFSPHEAVPEEIKNIKHIKKYVLLHDVIPMILPGYNEDWVKKNKKSWFYKLYHSINKECFYFANSQYTKQDFLKVVPRICASKVKVVPLSTGSEYSRIENQEIIQKTKEKYEIPTDKKYLFSLCTLEPRKNLIFAVKNFITFIKENDAEDLVFVLGGGRWSNFIEELGSIIDDLGQYRDKIITIGYVEDVDMSALYSGAEIFVFPSLYEGFGIPVLEAMKCGCPVITSNLTSMPEVIGDCGIKINPKEDRELVEALKKMYFDKEFNRECSLKGMERAKQFTWEKCVDVIKEEITKND